MSEALFTTVDRLIRQVAADVVLPHFRNLDAADIAEKAPNDFVTIADRESEARLTEGLTGLIPDAVVIGEEAVAGAPELLDTVDSKVAWLIDPIDGTGNYAAGRWPFGIMIALLEEGRPVAGWLYDPLENRMSHARAGKGAFVDGERVHARESGRPMPIAAIATYFMTEEQRANIRTRSEGVLEIVDIPRCAAEQYPRLVRGENDIAVFEKTMPWDHAAGSLFLSEAGGVIRRNDGSPYVVGDRRRGMLAAASPALWDRAATILFG